MPVTLQQSWPAPRSPKPVVIIGAGGIVRDAHLPAYRKAKIPVHGVVDRDPQRAKAVADDWSIATVFSSIEEAVHSCGTDVVYDVATPPEAIVSVLGALPERSAVLIQKPMGIDLAEARIIRALCREKGLKAAINFQLRFAPMLMAARDAIGLVGEVVELDVHVNVLNPFHLFPFLIPLKRVEIALHSIHYLDAIRSLLGNPLGVFARTLNDARVPQMAQTRTSAILDYGPGLRVMTSVNLNHDYGSRFQSAWIRIEGTAGAMMLKLGVLYDYPRGEPDEMWLSTKGAEWTQVPLEGSWFPDAFMGPMRNLQRFDSGEDDVLFSGVEDAFHTMALVEAAYASQQTPAVPLALD